MFSYKEEKEYEKEKWYCKGVDLPLEDQKYIWNEIIKEYPKEPRESVIVNGSVNGSCKLRENFKQNIYKLQAITELKQSNYRSSPKRIAYYLEVMFGRWESKPEHWLYIAQHYTPKTIKSVWSYITKTIQRGDNTIKTPGAYFTYIIKRKQKRKIFRNTNGTYKQHDIG